MGRAKTLISPEEYLSMSFGEREPEYVRGELIYRPMPDGIHGHLQGLLIVLLSGALRSLGYRITPETRSQLGADNFRLPDIAVFGPDQPFQVVPTEPPVIAVEIISKDERYSEILQKLEDYRSWGVRHIWTVDPRRRRLSVLTEQGHKDVDWLELPGTPFRVNMDELLRDLPADALS